MNGSASVILVVFIWKKRLVVLLRDFLVEFGYESILLLASLKIMKDTHLRNLFSYE